MAPTTFNACNVEQNFTDWPALPASCGGKELKGKGKQRAPKTKRGASTQKEQEDPNKQQQVCDDFPRLLGHHSKSLKPFVENETLLKPPPGLELQISSCAATDCGSNCSTEVTDPTTAAEPTGDIDGKVSGHREEQTYEMPAWLLPQTSISSVQVEGCRSPRREWDHMGSCGKPSHCNSGQLKRMSLRAYGEHVLADMANSCHSHAAATRPAIDTLHAPSRFVNPQAKASSLFWNGGWGSPLPDIVVDPVVVQQFGEIPAPPGLDRDVQEPRRIQLELAGMDMLDFQKDALVAGAINRTCTSNESSTGEADMPMKVDLTKLASATF